MKKKDTALLIGGTVTGMALVVNGLAFACIREHFIRRAHRVKPGRIESVDEMHADYLRRKALGWIKEQNCRELKLETMDGLLLKAKYVHNSEAKRAEGEPVNIVLLSHGYGGADHKDMLVFTEFYREQGYDMLVIDQRAHGKSGGSAITFGALEKEDVSGWVGVLNDMWNGNCRILLHGWGMGAAASYLAAAAGLPTQVKGIVYDSGYAVAESEFLHFAVRNMHLPKTLMWYIIQFMKPWCRILCDFNMRAASPLFVSGRMRLPIFFVHGGADSTVPLWMGRRLYKATDRTPYRNMLVVPEAEHTYGYIYDHPKYEEGILKLMDACMG